MMIVANFLTAIAQVLNLVLQLYMWLIIARAILSWVSPDPGNPIVRFLYSATEPLMYRVRRTLPVVVGGMDLSPLLILIGIYFLQWFLVQSLLDMAIAMR